MTLTCPRCGSEDVVLAVDYLTSERILLDRDPVRGGRVEVKRPPLMRTGLVAIDHISRPAPRQPAHELHARTCPVPLPEPAVDLAEDPGREQAGGWRR